jgi:hypothetical protein
MLVVDLDGTLLRDDKTISEENVRAIQDAHDCGLAIVLATGRPPVGAHHALSRLSPAANEYLITYNGALTTDLRTGRILAIHELTRRDFDLLAPYLRQRGVYCYAFSRDICLAPEPHEIIEAEQAFNGIDTAIVDFDRLPPDEPFVKIMATGDPDLLARIHRQLPAEWLKAYQVVQSAPILLEFMSPRAGKGQAVQDLCRQLGISAQDVICVGDAGNDMDMVAWAGLGVAMGNAVEALRALADHITDTNENNGIAQVIRRFIFQPDPCPAAQQAP